jgi:hypothetical protein
VQMKKAAALVMLQPSAPAREPTARMHVPSQPLMRSPLSQFQTPTAPRRVSRVFRVWLPFRSPCRVDHSAYFESSNLFRQFFSAVDAIQTKQALHRCQRESHPGSEIYVHKIVEKLGDLCFIFRQAPGLASLLHRIGRSMSGAIRELDGLN